MRRRFATIIAAGLACTLCTACGNLTTAFRTVEIVEVEGSGQTAKYEGRSVSIDAKQRLIIANPEASNVRICAEPSPDALTSLASSVGLSATTPQQIQAQLAYSTAESAASIGLRTQTIQLLRDAMYRICEGYMSNALSGVDFQRLHRRYQNTMLGLLAIEQLTGAVTAKQVVLSSSTTSSVAKNLLSTQEALNEGRAQLTKAKEQHAESKKLLEIEEKAKTSAQTKVTSLTNQVTSGSATQAELDRAKEELANQDQKVATAGKVVSDKEKQVRDSESNVGKIEEQREAARAVSTQASAQGALDASTSTQRSLDPASTKEIANTVKAIIGEIIGADFTKETCLNALIDNNDVQKRNPAATNYCVAILNEETAISTAVTQQLTLPFK